MITRNCDKHIADITNLYALYMVYGIIVPTALYVWSTNSSKEMFSSTTMNVHAIFGALFTIYSFIAHKLWVEQQTGNALNFGKNASYIGMFASIVLLFYILIA